MKKRTIISALLLLTALISSSCAPQVELPAESKQEQLYTEQITVPPEKDPQRELTLYDGGESLFRIVTTSSPSDAEKAFAARIRAEAKASIGKEPKTVKDSDAGEESICEVFVGYTSDPESAEVFASITYGQACIKTVGNKIFVAAFSKEGYEELSNRLCSLIKGKSDEGSLVFKAEELDYTVSLDPYLIYVPSPLGAGAPTVVDCGIRQTIFVHENASAEVFENYVNKIGKERMIASSEVGRNKFATFDISAGILNVSFTAKDGRLRIIYESGMHVTSLLTPENGVNSVCEPLLIMRGMAWKDENSETKSNGLCIVIRNSEGEFIIVDGGWDRQRDADDLYKLLKAYTPNGEKPHIAAWILTHAHEDHHSVFAFDFPNTYANLVTVENVIFNPPALGIYTGTNVSGHFGNEKEILSAIGRLKSKFVRPHVGDRYYIGDATLDIIYTPDMHATESFDYYNTCSLMLSISIAGQKIMITGDASNVAFGIASDIFGSELKSDIVQVAHHGYGTGVEAKKSTNIVRGYTFMSPTSLLWPASESGYQSGLKSAYNVALIRLPSVKKIIVAGETDHVFTLPYNAQ